MLKFHPDPRVVKTDEDFYHKNQCTMHEWVSIAADMSKPHWTNLPIMNYVRYGTCYYELLACPIRWISWMTWAAKSRAAALRNWTQLVPGVSQSSTTYYSKILAIILYSFSPKNAWLFMSDLFGSVERHFVEITSWVETKATAEWWDGRGLDQREGGVVFSASERNASRIS